MRLITISTFSNLYIDECYNLRLGVFKKNATSTYPNIRNVVTCFRLSIKI